MKKIEKLLDELKKDKVKCNFVEEDTKLILGLLLKHRNADDGG